ncbi:MAG TPA: hypothetical protein VGD01_05485 [Candidatus Elarobacter sp.]
MSAIVAYAPREPARRSRRGAATVLQFASGGVVADVRVERVERRNRRAWYAVKLAANASEVTGRLVGVKRGGATEELGLLVAASGAMSCARFAVTTPRSGAYEALFLELHSDEVALRVDAPRPPAPRGIAAVLAPAAALFALGAGAIVAGVAPLAFAHGSSGSASPRAAAARFPQPKLPALAAPAAVRSFSAKRDVAPGGRETVLASYLAAGERGTVALLDAGGTVVSSAPFRRAGTVRLAVPHGYAGLPMTVQITVHRGATKAVSSLDVPPVAATPATASPLPSPSATAFAGEAAPGALRPVPAGDIVRIDGAARAGRLLRLRIAPQPGPVRIELEDASGAAITETRVAAGASHAALPLPDSAERSTYLIALHYARNRGEETVVRALVAAPR